MELAVVKINGEEAGRKVVLEDSIFGIEPNDHAIYLDVKQIMANKRQGTSDSRERSDVSGRKSKKVLELHVPAISRARFFAVVAVFSDLTHAIINPN